MELYLKSLFKYIVEIYLHIMACGHGCLRSAVFLLLFLLDCSTNVAMNETIASITIPRRNDIVLRGTIAHGWEEGSKIVSLIMTSSTFHWLPHSLESVLSATKHSLIASR